MAAGRSADEVDELVDAGDARRGARQAVAFRPLALVRAAVRGRALHRICCSTRSTRWRRRRAAPRLLPDGQPLDLFVTVTDFRGHPERLRLNSPPEVVETEHRLVVLASPITAQRRRARRSGRAGLRRARDVELSRRLPALHGRRTRRACWRSAAIDWPGRDAFLERALPRQSAANAADNAVLIDGSVLANAPFRPAIDALRERPARREVDRRFVYIDPSPGASFQFGATAATTPGFFQTIIGAISEIPRQQPIRDNLEAIARALARGSSGCAAIVARDPARGRGGDRGAVRLHPVPRTARPPTRLAAWRAGRRTPRRRKAGYGYAAYGHLKVAGVVDLIARPAPLGRRRARRRAAARASARRSRTRCSARRRRLGRRFAGRRERRDDRCSCARSTSASASAGCGCSRAGSPSSRTS